MILPAIVLFCLAAVSGLSLVIMGVRYQRGSLVLGLGHAGIALLGLALLGVQIFSGPLHMLYNDAALLFVLALFGGGVLLAVRLRDHRKPPPMFVVGLHAVMALMALLLLVVGYMRH